MGEDSVLGFHLVGILAFSLSTQIFFFLATLVLSGFDPLVSVSQAYYISSLTESAQVFAKIIRGHWKIENQLHWVKDVIFEEDKSEISDFQAASNWSILTTIGLNLFRGLGFLSITEGQRWLAERWEKLIVLST
ncbi:Mobile element protein [Microcystis panniformis FACHB-1757]|uniref:Mobile element protein n=2 Tax=Microcystis TaxID=1125 RepID=A0A0K1S0A7_9CHRO|nr:Mobile element protein [Microcystis panniformis FACHB-1757]